ncbi:MAG: hypothetical protein SPJ90_08800, partial [Prevotella sp.]|nr:hypothetical protein [Prevotellaceae bacterium]MDY5844500.1 hypothetical protein [Prevotella sp.]
FAFFVLPIVLFGGFAPPAAWQTSAVFFMFFVQSKHQQILHFDFESLIALLTITTAIPIGYKNKFAMPCGQPSQPNKHHEDISSNNQSVNAL